MEGCRRKVSLAAFIFAAFIWLLSMQNISAKICHQPCNNEDLSTHIKNVDVTGCRRRKAFVDKVMDFRCRGQKGPPCVIRKGDTIYFNSTFSAGFPIRHLDQRVYWVSSFGFQLPWPGLDTNGCNHLKGKCFSDQVDQDMDFAYKINVLNVYPPGTYNLKWKFTAKDREENDADFGCLNFRIRIV